MGKQLESLPRFTRALMKSHLIACGFSYEDTEKPIIAIHLDRRTLDVLLSQEELGRGLQKLKPRDKRPQSKLLQEYAARVGTTSSGAVKTLSGP
jgi:dihydroxyacid dehydratase/phosphogluconate dehydratase